MNNVFPEINGRFGFGCMRLPMIGDQVDLEQTKKMVDAFLAKGWNYFDTAHGYINEQSETALKACLTERYPRDKYILTNKLSGPYFDKEEQIRPLFEKQLEACGVDYFDFYLMHAQGAGNFPQFKRCRAYEVALELKAEGKIRHLGISFHDKADVLDQILTEYPQIEIVQIQMNYLDMEDPMVQSRKCYEVCVKHGKPVICMEPVKGGRLVNLPVVASTILKGFGACSNAGYALRYLAGFENVRMIISGMSSMEQMEDNLVTMGEDKPLTAEEKDTIEKIITKMIMDQKLVSCTACRYCTAGCPQKIAIPDLFACLNAKKQGNETDYLVTVGEGGKASECIRCGKCERECPQHLPIRRLLTEVAEAFEA